MTCHTALPIDKPHDWQAWLALCIAGGHGTERMDDEHDLDEGARALFDASPDPMWVFDTESFRFLEVNQAAIDLYGYSREEFLDMTILDIRPVEDIEPTQRLARRLVSGVSESGIWRHRTKAGEIISVDVRTRAMRYQGRKAKLAQFRDVTQMIAFGLERDRLLQEANQRQREAEAAMVHFRALFDAIPGRYLVLDPQDYRIVAASNDILTAIGAGRDAILGRPLFEIFPADPNDPHATGVARLHASLDHVAQTGATHVMTVERYPIPRPAERGGGFEERFWSAVNTPVHDADGKLVYFVLRVEDVTEMVREGLRDGTEAEVIAGLRDRDAGLEVELLLQASQLRRANQRLTEQSTRLRTAKRLLSIGFWHMDIETQRLWWSDGVASLYGLPEGAAAPDFDAYVAMVHPDDRAEMLDGFETFMRDRPEVFHFEHRIVRPDGRTIYVRGTAERLRQEQGEQLTGVVQDITDIRAAEDERRRAADLLRMAGKAAQFGGWHVDLASGRCEWTEGMADIHGVPGTHELDLEHALGFYPDDHNRARISAAFNRCATEGKPFDEIARIVTPDGSRKWVRTMGEPLRDASGRIVAVQGAFQDITEQQEARSRFDVLARRLVTTLEQMGDAFYTLDKDARFTFVNSRAEELLRRRREDLLGRVIWDEFPEARNTKLFPVYRQAMDSGEPATLELYYPPLEAWFRVRAHPVEDGLAVYFRDITAVRGREQQLRLLEAAVARQSDVLVITDAQIEPPDGPRIVYANAAFERVTGYGVEEVLGKTPRVQQGPLTDRATLDRIRAALESGTGIETELVNYRKDGTPFWKEIEIVPLRDDDGRLTHWIAVYRDITQRKKAEQALRDSEERFRMIARTTNDVIWDLDLTTDTLWWSEGITTVLGFAPDQVGSGATFWRDHIHPEDRDRVVKGCRAVIEGGGKSWQAEYRFLCGDGRVALVADRGSVIHDGEGRPVRMLGSILDVTERRELEERLRQSQKLEAVGQLTGGIAHDFNNLLTIILGNAELMADRVAEDETLRPMVEATLSAAERGADLTRRLLTFARRQVLEPRALDLNHLLPSLDGILRRVLPETISVEVVRAAGLWVVEIDPGEFENALLNLAINARDAMPDGGKLTIETANAWIDDTYAARHDEVKPGQYVMVSVSDTGTGIPASMMNRVFEPFFTTKTTGKGTGLGLSMIYGFVKQSGGHVKIYSEIGIGTTVKLYFPRVTRLEEAAEKGGMAVRMTGGSEHILVVEDDPDVLSHGLQTLRALGYHVTAADTAQEALDLLHGGLRPDLLFTDVVMPGGMNGRELAEAAQALLPGLPVLYTSGYTRNAIVHHGRLDAGVLLLGKPYRREELARKVRAALDGTPEGDR